MRALALASALLSLLATLILLALSDTREQSGKVLAGAGVYHTAFPDFCPEEDCVSTKRVRDFEALVGRDLVWAAFSDNWFDGIHFPTREVKAIRNAGVVPYIRMMPRGSWAEGCLDQTYSLKHLARGRYDRELAAYAAAARDVRGPLLLDFAPEANGDWFPWSGTCQGGGRKGGYGDAKRADGPEAYVAAWRRLQMLFREANATNVTFVWHMDADGVVSDWNSLEAYYPGGVDWAGLSAYGAPGQAVALATQLDAAWPELERLHQGPLALLEFGTTAGPLQDDWLREAFVILTPARYPRLAAVGWWHSDWQNEDGSQSRLRLDSAPETLSSYRHGVRSFVTDARVQEVRLKRSRKR